MLQDIAFLAAASVVTTYLASSGLVRLILGRADALPAWGLTALACSGAALYLSGALQHVPGVYAAERLPLLVAAAAAAPAAISAVLALARRLRSTSGAGSGTQPDAARPQA